MKLKKIFFGREIVRNLDEAKQLEWLVTNGLGGYASSTIIGMNTRKYHGLLIASRKSPLDRKVLLSKLEEVIEIDKKSYSISTNRYLDVVYPEGYKFQNGFMLDFFPSFEYEVEKVKIRKTIFMPYQENSVIIIYEVKNGKKDEVTLKIRPLVNFRSIYSLTKQPFGVKIKNYSDGCRIFFKEDEFLDISCSTGCYRESRLKEEEKWYWNFFYEKDAERGEDAVEHCFSPGEFVIRVGERKKFYVSASYCKFKRISDVDRLLREEIGRRKKLLKSFFKINKVPEEEWIKRLVLAIDHHLIKRYDGNFSIIAGYPWFGEWGRDTFISFSGSFLRTGKFKEAKSVIEFFAEKCKNGLIPNMLGRFEGEEDSYNSVDTSLLFIKSVYRYYEATKDLKLIKKVFPVMEEIIQKYLVGTDFGIKYKDGILKHGPGLTWMDVRIDGKFVTPRENAVEIQALWYNALKIMEFFSKELKKNHKIYEKLAKEVKKKFLEVFWLEKFGYLKDCENDETLRPNQLLALDLDFKLLNERKERKILRTVEERLLTDRGLRTLAKEDPRFHGIYHGNLKKRDEAYHQGTIWPWLWGTYIRVCKRLGVEREKKLKEFVEREMKKLCVGSLCEIIDGDEPFESRGCISQAWSIAEILDAICFSP